MPRRSTGPADILVNNAGIQHVAPVEEFPTERWDAIIVTNPSAAFDAAKAVLPEMRRRGIGCVRPLRHYLWYKTIVKGDAPSCSV